MARKRLLPLFLSLALFSFSLMLIPTAKSQDTAPLEGPLAYTSALVAPDGSLNYSVFVGSGADPLTDVTITAAVPVGSTFQEVFWTPSSAELIGEAGGIVTWQLAELPANSLIGPFTIGVTFDDTTLTEFPAAISVTIGYSRGTIPVETEPGTVRRLADVGSITIDPVLGTGGEFLEVGETGILIDVLPNTFTQPVTFNFERIPIEDDTALPEVAETTWWCLLYFLSVEPADVDLTQGITLILPTRRTINPALEPAAFTKPAVPDAKWEILDETAALLNRDFARPNFQRYLTEIVIVPTGNQVLVQQPWVLGASQLQNLAVGVTEEQRNASLGGINSLSVINEILANAPQIILHPRQRTGGSGATQAPGQPTPPIQGGSNSGSVNPTATP